MATRYYCQYCNKQYTWSQESLTPGFCSSKCRFDQVALENQIKFKDLLQQQATERLTNQSLNSIEPIVLARDPAAIAREKKCEICNINSYQNKPIRFKLCHLDGNVNNDKPANLRLLCPNCQSQVEDYINKQ